MISKDGNNRNWKTELLAYLPDSVRMLLKNVEPTAPLEEIRIRANAPLQLCFSGGERMLSGKNGAPPVSEDDCRLLLQRLCGQSVYAWETELGGGFLTLPGGYRVGLSGRYAALAGGALRLTDVTGFNIRIARQIQGAAGAALPYLLDAFGRLYPTLVVSPPGCGKTTLLRDLARCCSYGIEGVRAARVAVVDTRFELTGCVRGVPQLDVGPRTDVLCGAPKADGMRMMVTNMSPEVLVTDELSSLADARAVFEAIACGVTVAASAHAGSADGLLHRRALNALLQQRLFTRIVLLGRSRGAGTVEEVLDASFQHVSPIHRQAKEVPSCCARLLS